MNEKNNSKVTQPNGRKLKKIYNRVKKQMEFYFSESNLVKDKFLSDLISKDPDGYVELDTFLKFNKIKAHTNNVEIIATAIAKSDLLEVSEDGKKVKRTTPAELSKDFDACTLYVEKLPHNADQKWVKDVLGQFGCIKYINVPRYRVTNKIKGFAFVEFENPDGVKNACEFYKISSEKECSASEDESLNVKNAKKHKHEESDKKPKRNQVRSASESSDKLTDFSSLKSDQPQEVPEKNLDDDKDHSHPKEKRKRKREDSFSEVATKVPKESDSEDPTFSTTTSDDDPCIKRVCCRSAEISEQMATNEENVAEVSNNHLNGTKLEETKAKRKRKSSKKHRSNTEKPTLRVMPKSEWKNYRNKYLELQRRTMSVLKKHIMLETQELKEQEAHVKSVDMSENKKAVQYVPSVIIKVKLTEPVKNIPEIKNQVKANVVVAYIDVCLDSNEIFIRCHSSEEAQTIVREEKLNHLGKTELIQGDEEKRYWEKIESDRKNKYENPVRQKKRGREKIIAKAAKLEEMKNKHIYFDE